jgi:Flp pilus assembly protein TadG
MRSFLFRRPPNRRRSRGQSLAEFAIVFPVLMLVLGGIIQFGIIFWAQNTLTQIARDTGRWAASQQSCVQGTEGPLILAKANAIAAQSSLIGYNSAWTSANVVVSWQTTPVGDPCPPTSNAMTSFVSISITHQVPIFFPFIPGNGTLSSATQFRMEPVTAP